MQLQMPDRGDCPATALPLACKRIPLDVCHSMLSSSKAVQMLWRPHLRRQPGDRPAKQAVWDHFTLL